MKFVFCCFWIMVASNLLAADIAVTLDSADGSSIFSLKDSAGSVVSHIDSDGNVNICGGMRLDSGGAKCAIPETMIIDGRLGVGQDSPQVNIHTWASVSDIALRVDNDNAGIALGMRLAKQGTEYAALQVGSDDSFNFYVHTGAEWKRMLQFTHDNQVINFETGEIGIGKSNPEELLHVSGDIMISKDKAFLCEDSAGNNVSLLRMTSSDSIELNVETLTTGNDYPLIMGGTTVDIRDEDNVIKVRIDESSEVGIGTLAPLTRLDVAPVDGTAVKFGSNKPVYMLSPWPCVGFNSYYDGSDWRFGSGSSGSYGGYITVVPSDGRMLFRTGNSGNEDQVVTTSVKMTLYPDVNVAIGPGTKAATLEVNGRIRAEPVCGRWVATNYNIVGPVRYQWGVESFNTDSSYMARTDSNYDITVYKAGYYLICVKVLIMALSDNERSDVSIRRNDVQIALSLGSGRSGQQFYKHVMNVIEYFNANDTIDIYNTRNTSNIYAGGTWSTLSISRLN